MGQTAIELSKDVKKELSDFKNHSGVKRIFNARLYRIPHITKAQFIIQINYELAVYGGVYWAELETHWVCPDPSDLTAPNRYLQKVKEYLGINKPAKKSRFDRYVKPSKR